MKYKKHSVNLYISRSSAEKFVILDQSCLLRYKWQEGGLMLGKRSPQRGMFEADNLYLDFVGPDMFYGFLARHRSELFRDEDSVSGLDGSNGCESDPDRQENRGDGHPKKRQGGS